MTALVFGAFLTVFAALLAVVAHNVRVDRLRTTDLAEINHAIDVDRVCATRGHNIRKVPTPTVWACTICGVRYESTPGWVGKP